MNRVGSRSTSADAAAAPARAGHLFQPRPRARQLLWAIKESQASLRKHPVAAGESDHRPFDKVEHDASLVRTGVSRAAVRLTGLGAGRAWRLDAYVAQDTLPARESLADQVATCRSCKRARARGGAAARSGRTVAVSVPLPAGAPPPGRPGPARVPDQAARHVGREVLRGPEAAVLATVGRRTACAHVGLPHGPNRNQPTHWSPTAPDVRQAIAIQRGSHVEWRVRPQLSGPHSTI
jgi:hypothetical protein